jgi:hypothetical protein
MAPYFTIPGYVHTKLYIHCTLSFKSLPNPVDGQNPFSCAIGAPAGKLQMCTFMLLVQRTSLHPFM